MPGVGGGVRGKEEENTVTVDNRRSWFASSQFSLASSGGLSGQHSHQVHLRAQTSPHQYLGERERKRKREREKEGEREREREKEGERERGRERKREREKEGERERGREGREMGHTIR